MLRLKNKVVTNASWIIICRVFQAVLNLIISMMTARYFGPANYGLINYAASVVAFFVPIMQLGLRSTLVQEYIKNKEQEGTVLGTSTVMMMVSAILCMIGVTSFVMVAHGNEVETIIVCVLYSSILLFQSFEMIQYWYQAKLLSKYTSIVSLCAYTIISIYKIYLLASQKSIYWFAISNALDYLLIACGLFVIYKKIASSRISFSLTLAKNMFSKSKYYIISSMMVTVFGHIGSIALEFISNKESVGFYAAAITCAGMTSFIFNAIIDSARPVILSYRETNYEKFTRGMEGLYAIIFYTSLIQSIGICCFAPMIVKILYGVEYLEAVNPLRIIAWYTIFSYFGPVRNIWILAQEKQKYLWILNLSGAVLSIALNFLLIPFWGVSGAAVAALLTQIFTNVIMSAIIAPLRENNKLMFRGINLFNIFKNINYFIKK